MHLNCMFWTVRINPLTHRDNMQATQKDSSWPKKPSYCANHWSPCWLEQDYLKQKKEIPAIFPFSFNHSLTDLQKISWGQNRLFCITIYLYFIILHLGRRSFQLLLNHINPLSNFLVKLNCLHSQCLYLDKDELCGEMHPLFDFTVQLYCTTVFMQLHKLK